MHPRAAHLISALELQPHPEGGHYREVYRSAATVRPGDGRAERSALTSIYFLLTAGEVSQWHRVASDEAWHFYEGDALELFWIDPQQERLSQTLLGRSGDGGQPVAVVPPNRWQAARTTGDYTLVGCTVGPGFDFADFQMLGDDPAAERLLRAAGLVPAVFGREESMPR